MIQFAAHYTLLLQHTHKLDDITIITVLILVLNNYTVQQQYCYEVSSIHTLVSEDPEAEVLIIVDSAAHHQRQRKHAAAVFAAAE